MLKLDKNQQRGPIGGHHYPSHGRTFRAPDFKELVKELTNFRLDNGIPIGRPDQDILIFYAKNWPWMVKPDIASDTTEDENYLAWRDWINRTWKAAPTKFITVKEAQIRWKTCMDCPFNMAKSWRESPESAAFTRRAFILRRAIDVPDYLGFCACHRADLGVFTFISDSSDHSARKDVEKPKECWVGSLAGL